MSETSRLLPVFHLSVTSKARAAIESDGGIVEEADVMTSGYRYKVTFPKGSVSFPGGDIQLPSGAVLGWDGSIDDDTDDGYDCPLYLKRSARE